MDHRIEANRKNWNERTPVHAASEFYDVAGFRNGRITLNNIERTEVGSVEGKSLLHLQCHFGMDTMSWARLGAQATGVDISGAAIDLAKALNDELQLNTRFICSNIYDLPDVLDEKFDIVYTAMGVLCWLPDLLGWANIIARFLKPNGIFYILDGHPFLHVFESAEPQAGVQELQVRYPYFKKDEGGFYEGGHPSYAGSDIIEAGCY
ncbi:class I SAM-dependent methyltransferase, partial [Candidatus Poribacteria bacterium]|nr:class I SAM-dependent methyltransferase [Candidatus Poribacteria bacterium]